MRHSKIPDVPPRVIWQGKVGQIHPVPHRIVGRLSNGLVYLVLEHRDQDAMERPFWNTKATWSRKYDPSAYDQDNSDVLMSRLWDIVVSTDEAAAGWAAAMMLWDDYGTDVEVAIEGKPTDVMYAMITSLRMRLDAAARNLRRDSVADRITDPDVSLSSSMDRLEKEVARWVDARRAALDKLRSILHLAAPPITGIVEIEAQLASGDGMAEPQFLQDLVEFVREHVVPGLR